MKISIIGLPGSGKSTLAKAIHEKLNIPHIYIDRFWLEAGGEETKRGDNPERNRVREYVKERVREAIAQESWVSDGFYSRLQSEVASSADILVFLDIPIMERLLNHIVRTFTERKRHAEVSFWDDVRFIPEVVRRTFRTGPKLKAFVLQYPDKLKILRSRREIAAFIHTLGGS